MSKRSHSSKGQALVEFAIVSIALLLIFFVIIELSRILWSWVTVQNAARQGARYAITGNLNLENCTGQPTPCDARVASIKAEALNRMTGMSLVEGDTLFEDGGMYRIEVYGINQYGELQPDFGGIPNQPVVVRVIYNVGIITPILNDVVEAVPVMGQVTMNNEPFGSLGGINTGISTAPNIPPIPTAGPTPTPVPCVLFEGTLVAGNTSINLTGNLGANLRVTDVTTGQVIGTGTLPNTPVEGHLCPTAMTVNVSPSLVGQHVIMVENLTNGGSDTATVEDNPLPPTATPTITSTPTPIFCPVQFEETLIAGDTFLAITADLGSQVEITDLATGQVIGTGTLPNTSIDGHLCPSFMLVPVTALIEQHMIVVEHSTNGSFDIDTVQAGTSTPTPLPTQTLPPTNTPSPTPSITPTPSPTGPFIILNASCYNGPTINYTVYGYNWPDNQTVSIFLDNALATIIASGHGGSFQRILTGLNVASGTHEVKATSATGFDIELFVSPCPNVTATPTTNATNTPLPPDLIAMPNTLALVSTPPIISYQPVTFQLVVSNIGEVNVTNQFFVDLFFDVPIDVIEPEGIPIAYAAPGAYMALSTLNSGQSQLLNITSPYGFIGGTLTPRSVYAMVDSLDQVIESNEENNLASTRVVVTPGPSPTPRPTTEGGIDQISGIVSTLYTSWVPQGRARVFLVYVEPALSRETVVQQQDSNLQTGRYVFAGVAAPGSGNYYKVIACFNVDGGTRVGTRSPLSPPNNFANVFMFPDAVGCPYN